IVGSDGNVAGHQKVGVAHITVHLDCLYEIDVALVRERFDEVVAMPANIAEMDVEDLFAGAEVTDYVIELLTRLVEHLGDGALAEIQPVIGAFFDGDEFLESVDRAKHAVDALVTLRRNAGVVRMASHAD